MTLLEEIPNRLREHLGGAISLDEFEGWLVSRVWEPQDDDAEELASLILLYLAEFSEGHRTKMDLDLLLARMATPWIEPWRRTTSFSGQENFALEESHYSAWVRPNSAIIA